MISQSNINERKPMNKIWKHTQLKNNEIKVKQKIKNNLTLLSGISLKNSKEIKFKKYTNLKFVRASRNEDLNKLLNFENL